MAVASALAWSGCGDSESGDTDRSEKTAPDRSEKTATEKDSAALRRVVTEEAIAQRPRNSPDRALLNWWQAVQFEDFEGVRLLSTRQALSRTSPRGLSRAVSTVASALGRPEIVRVRSQGDRAAVRVLIQSFGSKAGQTVSTDPATFELRRMRGKWRVGDLGYLLETAQTINRR